MKKKIGVQKPNRDLITGISMCLLSKEELRKQFWNIKSANYNHQKQEVSIGISTIEGKLGTTLEKLRKVSKSLSEDLYEKGITFKRAQIVFFVDNQEKEIDKIYKILDACEATLPNN